ncbi:CAP domain-containing protein [Candidatus Microgenomates bacterium]|nr:MAG: CAP domain-containing protein [Candidatus Microgenomates bacterium]
MKIIETIHHLIAPRHTNNYRARLLHPSGVTIVLLLIILAQSVFQFLVASNSGILGYASQISVEEVIKLTNNRRIENGLTPVVFNSSLSQAAKAKGEDMLNSDYWAHVSPTGTEPWKFFRDVGYTYRYAGENLARDFTSPVAAVDAWMASPSHRENMLSSKYKDIGVAVVEGDLAGQDTTIIVQLFGTLAQDSVTVPVAAAQSVNSTEVAATTAAPSATPSPSPTLVPVAAEMEPLSPVGGETLQPVSPSFSVASPFDASKAVSLGTIGFMAILLLGDILYISRRRINRKGSRTLAHLAFFVMIFAILLISKAGEII